LALGAQLHLVEPLAFSLDDTHVKRSGLDYWPYVSPVVHSDWVVCEQALKKTYGVRTLLFFTTHSNSDMTGLCIFPTESEKFRSAEDLSVACIFGAETAGLFSLLPKEALENQQLVRLPMLSEHIRSLNLAVSAGMGLWEVYRQQQERLVAFGELT